MSKLISVFPNTFLGNGHKGLENLARKYKVNTKELEPGELVLFINRAQTAFKAFGANNTLLHYKHQRGLIDIRAIQYLPYCLGENAGSLNYDKALEKVLSKVLKKGLSND